MIKELTALKDDEAEDVLSEVITSLLPNPENGTEEQILYRPEAKEIVAAVQRFIQLGGAKARTEVLDYAADRLSGRYLTAETEVEVRSRLGRRGELPFSQYRLVIEPSFKLILPLYGIRPSHIESAVLHPDVVQRLTPEQFGASPDSMPTTSLLLKRVAQTEEDAYCLLLHCVHKEDKLTVWTGAKIYDSDLKVRISDLSPLEIFRAFITLYGVEFKITDLPMKSKFVLYEVFPVQGEPRIENLIIANVDPDEILCRIMFARYSGLSTLEISFAYALRLDLYLADLARHGVKTASHSAAMQTLST